MWGQNQINLNSVAKIAVAFYEGLATDSKDYGRFYTGKSDSQIANLKLNEQSPCFVPR
jgi:hypothetical protein